MDIDEKLREILLSRTLGQYAADGEGNLVPVNWEDSPVIDQFVGAIKQAFAAAGAILPAADGEYYIDGATVRVDNSCVVLGTDYMKGQEWLNRFEKELAEGYAFDQRSYSAMQEAAKRAAGLDT